MKAVIVLAWDFPGEDVHIDELLDAVKVVQVALKEKTVEPLPSMSVAVSTIADKVMSALLEPEVRHS